MLLEECVQLVYDPYWLSKKGASQKQWYVDLVYVEWPTAAVLNITDLYLDIIIEENGPTYRMIDFDDLAVALLDEQVAIPKLSQALQGLQVFLDSHLHFAKDFPPKKLKPFWPA